MTSRLKCVSGCLLVLLLCSVLPSDDKTPAKHAEIAAKALSAFAAALKTRKSAEVADLFTPIGEFIDGEENVFQGRDAIAREFGALFEINPERTIELTADDVREVSQGLLTIEGTAQLTEGKDQAKQEIEFVAFLAQQADGRWLLASMRSRGEDDDETPQARLKRLEWLIGEWVDESDESTMHMTSRRSDDGNFIITDFAIHVAGRKVMTGMQRIGWDDSLEKFKSWVFDSEGGHAEGVWTELDDKWVVKSTGVNPDGDACSATQTYEPQAGEGFLFSVTDRIIGDDTAPDFTSRVVRKPPEPEKPREASRPGAK